MQGRLAIRILLIAPSHPDLPDVQNEVNAISSFHDVRRLVGDVRETDIQQAVRDGPFAVFWCATHGSPSGIMLSGTVLLSAEAIGQYVAASGAGLCVLNTCASEDVANRIIAGGEADMIYTISADIRDADALRFAALLASELAKTEDYEAAFRVAAGPGVTKYRYVKANEALRGVALQAASALDKLEEKVESLSRSVYEASVNARVAAEKSEGVRRELETIREQNASNNNRFVGIQQSIAALAADQTIATSERKQISEKQNANDVRRASQHTQSVTNYPPTFWLLAVLMLIGLLGLIFWLGGLIT